MYISRFGYKIVRGYRFILKYYCNEQKDGNERKDQQFVYYEEKQNQRYNGCEEQRDVRDLYCYLDYGGVWVYVFIEGYVCVYDFIKVGICVIVCGLCYY